MRLLTAALPTLRRVRRPGARPKRARRRFAPSAVATAAGLEARVVLSAVIEPFKVPLERVVVSQPGAADTQYKLGIYVGVGEGQPRLYEFDTGGKGFWAAYTPNPNGGRQWWGDHRVVGRRNLSITYSSGNQYLANQVKTSVQLYAKADDGGGFTQVIGTGQDVDLGQIVKYSDPNPASVRAWNQALRNGTPPLGGVFYGDFGASLAPVGTSQSSSISTILGQIALPEGLTPGFLVHAGDLNSDPDGAYLQIGLTESDLRSADTTLQMNRYAGAFGTTFAVTGLPTYSQQVATANFTWSDASGRRQRFENVGWTIDTGALLVNVWQGNELKVDRVFLHRPGRSKGFNVGRFKAGETFRVDASPINPGGTDFDLNIASTGTVSADNRVAAAYHATANMGRNYVNTGLLTFKQFDVMYNLAGGTIHFRKADAS